MGAINERSFFNSGPLSRWSRFLLYLFVLLLIVLPLGKLLVSLVFDFTTSSFTKPFWLLLAQSLFFTVLQASLSAFLTLLAACSIGLVLSHTVYLKSLDQIYRALGALGNFIFFLPSVTAALFVLNLHTKNSFFPSQGLWAIVAAHFFINFLFVFGKFYEKSRDYLHGSGEKAFQMAWLLGLSRYKTYRIVWGPLIKNEISSWFPLIFWWSFSNLSTLLILGGLQYSSPEILLFLSMQNDPGSSRILILVLLQLIIGFALTKFFLNRSAGSNDDFEVKNRGFRFLPSLPGDSALKSLSFLFLLIFLTPVLSFFCETLSAPLKYPLPSSIRDTLIPSFLFAFLSTLFILIFSFLLSLADTQTRRIIAFFIGISSTLFCLAYLSTDFIQRFLSGSYLSFGLMCLVQALIFLPAAALWISPRMESLPKNQLYSAFCLGVSEWGIFRWIVWPMSQDIWLRITTFIFIASLGEIVVTSLFMPDTQFLATAARKLSHRYAFDEAQWIVVIYMVAVAACLLLSRIIKRTRNSYGK